MKLNDYLCSVLEMEPRISESDIVYTFLHCLIRDEQELGKLKEGNINSGQLLIVPQSVDNFGAAI